MSEFDFDEKELKDDVDASMCNTCSCIERHRLNRELFVKWIRRAHAAGRREAFGEVKDLFDADEQCQCDTHIDGQKVHEQYCPCADCSIPAQIDVLSRTAKQGEGNDGKY
ncbi:MAG: hypothetical protein ABIJ86_06490 [Spirochaetota bacterium]